MSVAIDPVTNSTQQLYTDQISPSNSLRAFANLGLSETQRTQIRALTGNVDQTSNPNAFNAQVRSVLTPSQTTQFDSSFANTQNVANNNVTTNSANRSITVDGRQAFGNNALQQTPLQNVQYGPRSATEYYQALARSQNPNNTATENSAAQISSLLGVPNDTTAPSALNPTLPASQNPAFQTNVASQQAAANTLNNLQTQRELQNFGATGGVLNGFNVLTAFPVAVAQSTYAQADTAVQPVGRIDGAQNQSIQTRV